MIIYRIVRLTLLLLFALLQCVAPLAHAHVNGHHAARNMHIDSVDSRWMNAHDFDRTQHGAAQLSAAPHHSAVVCMPPEYRCSDLTIAQPAIASQHSLLQLDEYGALPLAAPCLQRIPLPPYQHPCSQAPPA